MRATSKPFNLGHVFGIPIRAHYSWLPVFPFYTWAIASFYLPREAPGLLSLHYWTLGLATTFLLFASVLAHELSHALMARAEGLGTGSITLYIFGGLATLEGQPANPASEFKIAVVGPASSFILGTVFLALHTLLAQHAGYRAGGQVFQHLGLVNWFLAGFNIMPGLPLDGGRVLRAVLWHFNKNFRLSTQIALRMGLIIAITLIIWGLYTFFDKDYITGMWSIIIGLVIAVMLGSSDARSRSAWHARRGTVEEVMNRNVVLISPDMMISDFINKVLNNNRHTSFPVARDKRLHGLLLLEELKEVPREEWARLSVRDCMRPVDDSMFISSLAPVAEARLRVEKNGLGRAVVLDPNGLIVGFLSLQDVNRKNQSG